MQDPELSWDASGALGVCTRQAVPEPCSGACSGVNLIVRKLAGNGSVSRRVPVSSQGSAVSLSRPLPSVSLSPLARGSDLLSDHPLAGSGIHSSLLNFIGHGLL